MESLQPPSSAALLNEQTPTPLETAGGHPVDSPTSTIPLDESSSSGPDHEGGLPSSDAVTTETSMQPIPIDDSEEDRHAQSPSRPRRAHVNRTDYSYRGYLDVMNSAATESSSPQRKRKRRVDPDDAEDITSTFVTSYEKFRHEIASKIKKVEGKLLDSKNDNEVLKQQKEELGEQKELWVQRYEKLRQQNDGLKLQSGRLEKQIEELKQQNDGLKLQSGRLEKQIEELKQQNDGLKLRNGRLEKQNEEFVREYKVSQEQIESLKGENYGLRQNQPCCPVCLDSDTTWNVVGCGHIICTSCVKDLKRRKEFWDEPCPSCRTPIKMYGKCYIN